MSTSLNAFCNPVLYHFAVQVSEYIESVGARPLSSFRTALQGQCKALLEHNHTRCMQQLQGLLEAEQWVAVDVPAGFQVGPQGAAAGVGPGLPWTCRPDPTDSAAAEPIMRLRSLIVHVQATSIAWSPLLCLCKQALRLTAAGITIISSSARGKHFAS